MTPFTKALRAAFLYVLISAGWIIFSDYMLERLWLEPAQITLVQSYKGTFFVLVTGIIFFFLLWSWLKRETALRERDTLTQLRNWFMFRSELQTELDQVSARADQLSLILFNIDNFRQLNSRAGPQVGDDLLRGFADLLREIFDEHAIHGRVSADEFAVTYWGKDITELAINKVRRVQHQLRSFRLPDPVADIPLSCSVGIANFPEDGNSGKMLITTANLALSEAREASGKGNVCVYSESYGESMKSRLQLILDLKAAIEADQFSLVYQPQYDLPGLEPSGVEVLVRWKHPKRGFVPPDVFIEVAEQQGLVGLITDFVCKNAMRELQEAGVWEHLERVSINVSALDIASIDSVERFEQRFESVSDISKIQLEITETAVMNNIDETIWVLRQLQQRGIQISVDDFGTGYSSLGVLRRLPVQELKIDRTFISDLENSESDQMIVHTIIAMAHALNLRVVAEGVESPAQQLFLQEHQCDVLQGYLLSRPVPLDELTKLFK